MSNPSQGHTPQGEELNPAEQAQSPLERAQQVQQEQRQNLGDAVQPQADVTPEVPGAGSPSDRRHHPQRQLYGSGPGES